MDIMDENEAESKLKQLKDLQSQNIKEQQIKQKFRENPEDSSNQEEMVMLDINKLSNIEKEPKLPAGYMPIELSTKGLIGGAPKKFHIRSFDTKDLCDMALASEEELPLKLVELFDKLILEEGISVANFHTNEVIELVVKMINIFISKKFEIKYTFTEDDWKNLASKLGGEESAEYKMYKDEYHKGTIEPKIVIEIDKLKYYEVTPEIKTIAKVKGMGGFNASFSYPKYGDVAVLKKFLDTVYKEQDKKYSRLSDILKFKQNAEQKVLEGDTKINFRNIPHITEAEEKEINAYNIEKTLFMVSALKALHLVEYEGKDVSGLSLSDKIELIKDDSRFTHEMFSQIQEAFETKFKVGINTEQVSYKDPVLGGEVVKNFPFRLDSLIEVARDTKSDFTVIEFD